MLDALAESALPVYLLHQPVIVLLGFAIVQLQLGIASKFLLLLVSASLGILVLYRSLRRFDAPRFLLGMRRQVRGSHAPTPRLPAAPALEV